ncbi:MAG: type II toxin-antitoxin system RelB/DinJ family antitoxin [Bifidobacterium breve]|nr:type II toxin-antitoxin system RelB/DinJ family antitoxin [Bifidobacterium breve]
MANTPTTTMRINPELKTEAMNILEPLGLSLSGAVNIFLKAVVREQGMPLDLHSCNNVKPKKTKKSHK